MNCICCGISDEKRPLDEWGICLDRASCIEDIRQMEIQEKKQAWSDIVATEREIKQR